MHLLIGLIAVLVAVTVIRALLPDRPALAAVPAAIAAAALLFVYRADLLQAEFWAGAIGFVAILSALLVVLHPNPMMSVLFLIMNLFAVALFYLMLQAQFLAVLQVIVYAGAIMVLFLFVIMLLNLRAEEGLLRRAGGAGRAAALLFGAGLAAILFQAIRNRRDRPYFEPGGAAEAFGTARELGSVLFGRHLFAFEAASILLVAAMVGAVILAKRRLE